MSMTICDCHRHSCSTASDRSTRSVRGAPPAHARTRRAPRHAARSVATQSSAAHWRARRGHGWTCSAGGSSVVGARGQQIRVRQSPRSQRRRAGAARRRLDHACEAEMMRCTRRSVADCGDARTASGAAIPIGNALRARRAHIVGDAHGHERGAACRVARTMAVALRALAVARLYERFGLVAANPALAHVELPAIVLAHHLVTTQ